jgi:D-aspartate ligase
VSLGRTNDERRVASDERIPVVITGADLPAGLGLARSLRDLGVPLYGLAVDRRSPCCRSSAWSDVWPVAEDSEQGWTEALLKLSTRHPRQVLFPAQDTVVDIISRNREVLGEHYLFVLPEHPTVQLLADKSAFAPWAEANGFPAPRTHVVSSPDELDAALNDLTFPVVLKPFTRNRRWHDASGRNKAYRLNSPAAVANIPFQLFDVSDRYVVQEWIEGNDSDVHFCLVYRNRSGRELAYQTGRKLVQWPVGTGNTAICTTTEDRSLHRLTKQLFDRTGFVGMASVEVKRDRRDGKYYITEPTVGRPNLQSNVATAAGRNLAVIAYHDARGVSVDTGSSHGRNAIWLSESSLLPAFIVAALRRQLNLVELGRALFRCRAVMFAYGGRGDMRPLMAQLVGKLRAGARPLIRRRRLPQP